MKNPISSQNSFIPSPIYEIAAKVAKSHQITEAEKSVLRNSFLKSPLHEEEHRLIDRLYHSLRRGKITLV
ncbi:MAG: hypothetical protein KME06_05180 [Kastovskya adunca ATA6-11-RM4]|jgi:hypothetical protein|nr:hypothetical protein [Kastovskya adunca ATA6-11-RM4]